MSQAAMLALVQVRRRPMSADIMFFQHVVAPLRSVLLPGLFAECMD